MVCVGLKPPHASLQSPPWALLLGWQKPGSLDPGETTCQTPGPHGQGSPGRSRKGLWVLSAGSLPPQAEDHGRLHLGPNSLPTKMSMSLTVPP